MNPELKVLLRDLQKRPEMYYGRSEKSFALLRVYVYGVIMGEMLAQSGACSIRRILIPDGFDRFVTQRFGRPYPDGGKNWTVIIEENSISDTDAFDLFFALRNEYEQSNHS